MSTFRNIKMVVIQYLASPWNQEKILLFGGRKMPKGWKQLNHKLLLLKILLIL